MPYLLDLIEILPSSSHGAAALWYAVGARGARPVVGIAALIATVPPPVTLRAAALPSCDGVFGALPRVQFVVRRRAVPVHVPRGGLAIRVQNPAATACDRCSGCSGCGRGGNGDHLSISSPPRPRRVPGRRLRCVFSFKNWRRAGRHACEHGSVRLHDGCRGGRNAGECWSVRLRLQSGCRGSRCVRCHRGVWHGPCSCGPGSSRYWRRVRHGVGHRTSLHRHIAARPQHRRGLGRRQDCLAQRHMLSY